MFIVNGFLTSMPRQRRKNNFNKWSCDWISTPIPYYIIINTTFIKDSSIRKSTKLSEIENKCASLLDMEGQLFLTYDSKQSKHKRKDN